MKLFSESTEKTIELGRTLGEYLPPGSVICLEGNLGAGKTHFAKGVALGLGVSEHVTSPTFTIINEYEGRLPFYHVDAYRLEDAGEANELGLEEYIYGDGVTIVEWPDRITDLLPGEFLTVKIYAPDPRSDVRELEFMPRGDRYERIVDKLSACTGYGAI